MKGVSGGRKHALGRQVDRTLIHPEGMITISRHNTPQHPLLVDLTKKEGTIRFNVS